MGGLTEALTTIAACGGVGAFIDFWIGKNGEKRVRSWLETWWLRFSYVNIRNFGWEEAIFAKDIIDSLFGPRLFSWRRFLSTVFIILISAIPPLIAIVVNSERRPLEIEPNDWWAILTASFIMFAIAVSITRSITLGAAKIIAKFPQSGIAVLVLVILIQYILLRFWTPIIGILQIFLSYPAGALLFAEALLNNPLSIFTHAGFSPFDREYLGPNLGPDGSFTPGFGWSILFLGWLSNAGRLVLAGIFLGSYVLKPLHSAISTLWARVVESDKPVFTVVFSGAAALTQATAWLLKRI